MEIGDWKKLFEGRASKLVWGRLPAEHGGPVGTVATPGSVYVELRLKEMFLRTSRKLWRKFYPMLHAATKHGGIEEHAVAGPGQLRELGDVNLERLVNLNQRLAGPMPYTGEDFSIVVGLYAIPGADASKALIDTIGTLAQLAQVGGGAVDLVHVVKGGIERVVGLNSAELQLGVLDTFYIGQNPLSPGLHVGIAAPPNRVNMEELWFETGTLKRGQDPPSSRSYEDHDYMVLEINTSTTREDWRRLPRILEYEKQFDAILGDGEKDVATKQKQLEVLWTSFGEALRKAPELIDSHRESIRTAVGDDLRGRLQAQKSGSLFETRSLDGRRNVHDPTRFDFAEVDE